MNDVDVCVCVVCGIQCARWSDAIVGTPYRSIACLSPFWGFNQKRIKLESIYLSNAQSSAPVVALKSHRIIGLQLRKLLLCSMPRTMLPVAQHIKSLRMPDGDDSKNDCSLWRIAAYKNTQRRAHTFVHYVVVRKRRGAREEECDAVRKIHIYVAASAFVIRWDTQTVSNVTPFHTSILYHTLRCASPATPPIEHSQFGEFVIWHSRRAT